MEEPYTYQQIQPNKIRRMIILSTILVAVLALFFFVYSHGFISVNVSGVKEGPVTYEFINQKTGDATVVEAKSGSLKKMVARGDYEVVARQGETSYYALTRTGLFLSTTTVEGQLQPEKARSFVGNNPGSCMNYARQLLLSYNCDAGAGSLKIHMPATSATPTTAQPVPGAPGDVPIGGTIEVNGKTMILMNQISGQEGSKGSSVLYELAQDLTLANPVALAGIAVDEEKSYTIQPYKNGFILYDDKMESILYYDSLAAQPEEIKIEAPEDEELEAFEVTTQGDRLAVIYSQTSGNESPDEDQERAVNSEETVTTKGKTIFQVYQAGKVKSFTFKGGYTSARLCGEKYICLINGPVLTVHDISGGKQKQLFRVNDAADTLDDGGTLVVFREKDVVGLDMESRTGQIQYSFGSYIPCETTGVEEGGYIVCVTDPKNTRSSLYVDTRQPNTGSIDKKVLSLLEAPFISAVSAYKSYVYIVPELGSSIYSPETNTYGPDPEVKQKASADINKIVGDLGIDRSTYNIINTQP